METTRATARVRPRRARRRALFRALGAGALAAAAAGTTAACTGRRGPAESSFETSVRLAADTALRVARTQLQLHGFEVTAAGENALVTSPRPVPTHLQGDGVPAGRHWMLRVEAQRRALAGGSRVRVLGYLLPPPASDARASGPTTQPATLVTSDNGPLFGELRTVGRWIEDAAGRAKR